MSKKLETIDVTCPKCGKRIGKSPTKAKGIQIFNCRNCWKRIWFNSTTGESEVKEMPQRDTSSGYTFV